MNLRIRKGFAPKIGAAVLLLCVHMLFTQGRAEAWYRFDDVFGPSGVGAQWMVVTTTNDSGGASTLVRMDTEADLINAPGSAYLTNGGFGPGPLREAIYTLFLVLPEGRGILDVNFDYVSSVIPTGAISPMQDVNVDAPYYNGSVVYNVVKTAQGFAPPFDYLYELNFAKAGGISGYQSARGNFIFHQNDKDVPSQTLQVPFIIANVHDGMAQDNRDAWLRINSTMRDNTGTGGGGSGNGNIVARDKFRWGVQIDYDPSVEGYGNEIPDSFKDWVFVPLTVLPIDSNAPINYTIQTDVTNYSGIRYALQRYDGYTWHPMTPIRWGFDIPRVADVPQSIQLDPLSHIPPGLVTTYNQRFNVVTGVKETMHMYPVDPGLGFRNMIISHRSIFGLNFGSVAAPGTSVVPASYIVNGFKFLPAQIEVDFLKDVGKIMSVSDVKQPSLFSMAGSVAYQYVASDAVNSFKLSTTIPGNLTGNTTGLLPIHVTMNLPKSNQIVSLVWDKLLDEARSSEDGNIREIFSNYFSVFMRSEDGYNLDLIDWLKNRSGDTDAFRKTVKVFLDEQRNVITVHFIALMMDGGSAPVVRIVNDSTITPTENTYIIIRDGSKNNRWDMTFFTAPKSYVPTDGGGYGGGDGKRGSGGGGCDAVSFGGGLLALAMAFLAPVLLKRR
ncbi:hypothetical protein AGMMS50276_21030 [Synergistales bacterium]|nr:hypothetical protein AGMMS50276_21030 [Synergistales bacterium]